MKKKNLLLVLLLMASAVSCSSKNKTSSSLVLSDSVSSGETIKKDLKILCPQGAPSVAFYNYADNNNFETNGTPSTIISNFATDNYDVIVIDTTSGIKQIVNNHVPYKLAANITLGNFYIASTGNDDDGVMDADDKIILFGQSQTADLVFHYIYGNSYDDSIEYVNAVADAAKCLASGKNLETGSEVDYVFIAQPVLFATLNNTSAATYGKAGVYSDVQKSYINASGGKSLIQASVFVSEKLNDESVDYFMSSLKKDIEEGIADPDKIAAGMNKLDEAEAKAKFGITANVAKATMSSNSLGLGFVKAYDNKAAIDSFISLFSMDKTNEEIYYK